MNSHIGGVNALHAANGDALSFVLVLISGFPEGLCGAVCQTANHGRTTGRLDVYYAGQILQTSHQAEVLLSQTVGLAHAAGTFQPY